MLDASTGMADSVALLQRSAAALRATRLVVLGLSGQEPELVPCVACGARGLLGRDTSLAELTDALRQVAAGEPVCSPPLIDPLFRQLARLASARRASQRAEATTLTAREMEVLRRIAAGRSNQQIAGDLHLSLHTIKNHVHKILDKLQVAGRNEAARLAAQRGWLPATDRA